MVSPVHPRGRGDGVSHLPALSASNLRFTPAGAGTAPGTRAMGPRWTVHPRGRGDGERGEINMGLDNGSPPRARGRRDAGAVGVDQARFTPAGAGTARWTPSRTSPLPVHPRGRGDGDKAGTELAPVVGSPPRARGRRRSRAPEHVALRFTPAGAGTAGVRPPPPRGTAVHPRGRGDGAYTLSRAARENGSPPRARGRLSQHGNGSWNRRFTPAGAGTASR